MMPCDISKYTFMVEFVCLLFHVLNIYILVCFVMSFRWKYKCFFVRQNNNLSTYHITCIFLQYVSACDDQHNAVWFKTKDSISSVYISRTINGMWIICITFERRDPKFSSFILGLSSSTAVQQRQLRAKWLLGSTRIFCVREFIKTAVQRAFLLRFNIQPQTRKSICRWNHQFDKIGCLCKGKSSGRPRVSEENVRRIQESFERSPRKSTRRASRELGIPQPTVWCVLRRRLFFNWVHFLNHPV